jgi:hypothetical protein
MNRSRAWPSSQRRRGPYVWILACQLAQWLELRTVEWMGTEDTVFPATDVQCSVGGRSCLSGGQSAQGCVGHGDRRVASRLHRHGHAARAAAQPPRGARSLQVSGVHGSGTRGCVVCAAGESCLLGTMLRSLSRGQTVRPRHPQISRFGEPHCGDLVGPALLRRRPPGRPQ